MHARALQAVCSRAFSDGQRAAWARGCQRHVALNPQCKTCTRLTRGVMRARAERESRPAPKDWPAFFVFYNHYWEKGYGEARKEKGAWLAKTTPEGEAPDGWTHAG